MFFPRLSKSRPIKVTQISDAGQPSKDGNFRGKWQGGIGIGAQELHTDNTIYNDVNFVDDACKYACIHVSSGLTARTAHSSFDGETVTAIQAADISLAVALMLEELQFGLRPTLLERLAFDMAGIRHGYEESLCFVPVDVHTDCEDLVKVSESLTFKADMHKRRKPDVFDLRELLDLGLVREMKHIEGRFNPLDAISKRVSKDCLTMIRFRELFQQGRYQPVWGKYVNRRKSLWAVDETTEKD